MKKFLIILLVLLSGCAKNNYVIPPRILDRLHAVNAEIGRCIQPTYYIPYYIYPSPIQNGMFKDDKIYLSDSLFSDENTLKFVIAHEIAHQKLGHMKGKHIVRMITSGGMLILNAFIPGAGLMGLAAHPLSQATYAKPQEFEADLAAYTACLCMGMTKDDVLNVMTSVFQDSSGGGLWDSHPSMDDRIQNIKTPPR